MLIAQTSAIAFMSWRVYLVTALCVQLVFICFLALSGSANMVRTRGGELLLFSFWWPCALVLVAQTIYEELRDA